MKIFCFGDSNTYGYDPRTFFGSRYPAHHRWVDILSQKLSCETVNAGENGRQIPSLAGEMQHFDLMLTNQEPVDLLVIMLGSNDLLQGHSAEAVAQRMASFLSRINMDNTKILLVGPPPMQLGEWVPTQTLIDASVSLNRAYKVLSEQLGVGFADAGEWNISMTFDGVHFNEEGHQSFADGLYQAITGKGNTHTAQFA